MNFVCEFCNKACKNHNSWRNHERLCKLNPNRQLTNYEKFQDWSPNKGKVAWNKGLTKETDNRVMNHSKSLCEHYKDTNGTFAGKHHSEDSKKKISLALLQADHSNKDRFSHGRKGYFDNIFFMSTYELAYYIYMRDHKHDISRCSKRFKYEYQGKQHYYTPDFVCDGQLIETKGYETDKDRAKYDCVENLKVLYCDDVKPYIDYVKVAYNVNDISELYTGE